MMNADGCYHLPTAPGQTMCQCMDHIMWLRFCLEVQGQVIVDLNRQLHGTGEVRYLRLTDGSTVSKPV